MTVILATQKAGESCELGASLDYTAKIHLKEREKEYILTPFHARVPYLKFLLHNFHLLQSYLVFKVQIQGLMPFS